MPLPILATKLYVPPLQRKLVPRPRLVERLNEGLRAGHPLTLISASAGFGKTTLLSEWVRQEPSLPVAWLSLDEGDNDLARFLTYLIAALKTIAPDLGATVAAVLQSPQPPPIEWTLTTLLNEVAALPQNFVLVLDDYHVLDAKPIDAALTFLLDHLPRQMHLVVATREDPPLPLSRLRVRDQLTELRAADLRFTPAEAADFLNRGIGLQLSAEDISILEARTEGWIAALQLVAIALQGPPSLPDASRFIQTFTGTDHFVLDYLVQEVLERQPQSVQTFLLTTAILDRLSGPLCDAVLLTSSGQATLEYLERSNLFLVPLDNERRWFRYHQLFADLLRQRLRQSLAPAESESRLNELHLRASQWYEDNGMDVEAFQHAAAANAVERAERLIEGKGIPLQQRGAVTAILDWLASLPTTVLNARPSLWWRYASLLLVTGQPAGVEEKLRAAEDALPVKQDAETRDLIGRIAAARATLALIGYQAGAMQDQSRRALEYLSPENLSQRASANWTLGVAYNLQGNRAAAREALTEAIALSQSAGAAFTIILATLTLANVQETENELMQAAENYRRVLQWAGDQPLQVIGEAHVGLARILYEWNDLQGAEQHGQDSLRLEKQFGRGIDRFIICELLLARVKLAQGDLDSTAAILARIRVSARQQNFVQRLPEIAAAQVLLRLRQGFVAEAGQLAQSFNLPVSQARVYLAQGDPAAAQALLEPLRQELESKGGQGERLRLMVLQALGLQQQGQQIRALQVLAEALALAEPGGLVRTFVDEGPPMAQILSTAKGQGLMPDYVDKLLTVFAADGQTTEALPQQSATQALVEPLSPRELDVLRLIAQGLSNQEISQKLFLALDTIKGHNRRIFDKLEVQRRTEAVARARELGLL